jgi:hypothetical protein
MVEASSTFELRREIKNVIFFSKRTIAKKMTEGWSKLPSYIRMELKRGKSRDSVYICLHQTDRVVVVQLLVRRPLA